MKHAKLFIIIFLSTMISFAGAMELKATLENLSDRVTKLEKSELFVKGLCNKELQYLNERKKAKKAAMRKEKSRFLATMSKKQSDEEQTDTIDLSEDAEKETKAARNDIRYFCINGSLCKEFGIEQGAIIKLANQHKDYEFLFQDEKIVIKAKTDENPCDISFIIKFFLRSQLSHSKKNTTQMTWGEDMCGYNE